MGDLARPLLVDPDDLERVTAEAVREVPAHLVPGEVRRRLALLATRRAPSQATVDRARKIAEEAAKR